MTTFAASFRNKLDLEVARIREEHPEYVIREIATAVPASIGEIRASLRRLGITMLTGRRPRRNREN